MNRLDLRTVLDWVPTGSRVLDLGCGDGTFLARLRDERAAIGVGVDIDPNNLVAAVAKRDWMSFRGDINDGLHCFTANRFDVVVPAHVPFRELTHPHIALQRMVDIADEAIVFSPGLWPLVYAGCLWESKVKCRCRAPCRYIGATHRTSAFAPSGILKRCAQH